MRVVLSVLWLKKHTKEQGAKQSLKEKKENSNNGNTAWAICPIF